MFTDAFIGEAELSVLSENRVTEGRHILALTGTSGTTYGSLTVEVTLRIRYSTVGSACNCEPALDDRLAASVRTAETCCKQAMCSVALSRARCPTRVR